MTRKRSFHTRAGSRSAVRGATARPSLSVNPDQKTALSSVRIPTFAPSTGAPSSRRVTSTTVLRGLSFTLSPRFVT